MILEGQSDSEGVGLSDNVCKDLDVCFDGIMYETLAKTDKSDRECAVYKFCDAETEYES